jgi:hypothetical protein
MLTQIESENQKISLRKPRLRWEYNTEMQRNNVTGCEGVY